MKKLTASLFLTFVSATLIGCGGNTKPDLDLNKTVTMDPAKDKPSMMGGGAGGNKDDGKVKKGGTSKN